MYMHVLTTLLIFIYICINHREVEIKSIQYNIACPFSVIVHISNPRTEITLIISV